MPELAEVRARVENDLDDATLQTIVDGEVEALTRHSTGAATTQTSMASGLKMFSLNRLAASITSIVERRRLDSDPVTLSANDYRLVGNFRLLRLADGDNPSSFWGEEVVVNYTPEVDQNLRDRIVFDLVQLAVEFRALDSEEVGDVKATQKDFDRRRKQILAQLDEGRGTVL